MAGIIASTSAIASAGRESRRRRKARLDETKPEDTASKSKTKPEDVKIDKPEVKSGTGKRRGKRRAADTEHQQVAGPSSGHRQAWPYIQLTDSNSARSLPPVFSPDGVLCFIASGAAIKIYSVQSCQLVSTLAVPSRTTPAEGELTKAAHDVSSLFVNPSNNLQLVTTTYDGVVCLWDYLDGTVLRVFETATSIQLAAISRSRPNDLFLCLRTGKPGKKGMTIVRVPISLEPKDGQRKLGIVKDAVAMAVSNDGKYMVVLGSREITVVLLEQAMVHKPTSPDEFTVSFEGSSNPETVWTELALHPLENYFVTGENTGKIKFWYILREDRLKSIQEDLQRRKHRNTALAVPPTCTAVVHWHAHAVSALRFTGNGAYLMSGGEEGVIVMWSMAASAMHKDFVPRLGGPIVSLSHTNYYEMQQELVARLVDGSIVFISSGTLEITRIISGLKAVKVADMRRPLSADDDTMELPLAIEPYTGHLVINASHPSAIQFFSPQTSTNIAELEIAPRNYIARRDERPLTHTCVERIVFSPESSQGTSDQLQPTWMATFDTWKDYAYTPETHLKIWIGYPASASASARPYTLNTRIDKPHGDETLTSMSFPSSSTNHSVPLQLATTSRDGLIKLWTHRILDAKYQPEGAWVCQYSFNVRSLPALDSAFSHDASLLAVLHPGSISLWSTETARLVRSITIAPGTQQVDKICFAGLQGDLIAVSGGQTLTFWDLLSCEEIFSAHTKGTIFKIFSPTGSNSLVVITGAGRQGNQLIEINLSNMNGKAHSLPFPVSAIRPFKQNLSTRAVESYLAITSTGEVAVTGPSSSFLQYSQTNIEGAKLSSLSTQPKRLFDDIFGANAFEPEPARAPAVNTLPLRSEVAAGQKKDIFDEVAPHAMPSLDSLWREMITSRLKPLQDAPLANGHHIVKDEDSDSEDSSDGEQAKGDGQEDTSMQIDNAAPTAIPAPSSTDFVDSPASLKDIFAKVLTLRSDKPAEPEVVGDTSVDASNASISKRDKKSKNKKRASLSKDGQA